MIQPVNTSYQCNSYGTAALSSNDIANQSRDTSTTIMTGCLGRELMVTGGLNLSMDMCFW